MSDKIKYLDDENFSTSIEKGVTLVDFYADWCGPCKMIAPIMEKLADEFVGKAQIAKIDIDQSVEVTTKFQVTSIPTLILFKNGKEIKRVVGVRDQAALSSIISSAL